MEAYEGHKMDASSLFNHKHQQFFEDVLLPRLRDELHIQRQLIVDSLQERMVNLPYQGTHAATESFSFASMSSDSLARVGVADQPDKDTSFSVMPLTSIVDIPDTSQTETDDRPKSALSALSALTKAAGKRLGIISDAAHKRHRTRARLHRHLHSSPFRIVMSVLIAANAIIIGIQTQEEFASVLEGVEPGRAYIWTTCEVIFTTIFSLELLLRACADGPLFLQGELGFWNIFDAVLVAQALFSLLCEGLFVWFFTPNFSFIRVLRILRFFRVLRVLRVMRNFRSFRIMIISLANSFQSLLWVLLMLVFVMYLFSIFILHCIMASFHDIDDIGPAKQELHNCYGGLAETLLSLFMAITGGKDWADLYRPLARLHGPYGFIFVCYIFFSVFGVLNVVTSMFVDSVNNASLSDYHHVLQCELDRRKQYARACRAFFFNADTNRSGKLSRKELSQYLQANRNKARLTTLELDESQAWALYTLVDVNEEDNVDIEDFVQGCAQQRGPAKAIDLSMLSNENAKFMSQSKNFMDLVQEKLDAIVTKIGASAKIEPSAIDAHSVKVRVSGNRVWSNSVCKMKSDQRTPRVKHKLVEQNDCMPTRTLDTSFPDAVPDRTPTSTVQHFSL